ncbi:MAG: hypothetical protein ABIQ57_18320, partial [Candidatus Kapaibacterium sp.]
MEMDYLQKLFFHPPISKRNLRIHRVAGVILNSIGIAMIYNTDCPENYPASVIIGAIAVVAGLTTLFHIRYRWWYMMVPSLILGFFISVFVCVIREYHDLANDGVNTIAVVTGEGFGKPAITKDGRRIIYGYVVNDSTYS